MSGIRELTYIAGGSKHFLSRSIGLGMRSHFGLMVITKVDTKNDNVVITGGTISKQSPYAIYSAPVACIVRQEIVGTQPIDCFRLSISNIFYLTLF